MTTTRIYTRKGAFWAVTHKTATGTSTLAAFASNNEVVPENRAWWMQGTLKQISVPATAGNILTVLSPTVGRQAPIYNADGTPTANSFGF